MEAQQQYNQPFYCIHSSLEASSTTFVTEHILIKCSGTKPRTKVNESQAELYKSLAVQ